MKNKKYLINLEVPFDLESIVYIFGEEAQKCPKEFAKIMEKFGLDGD